MTCPICKRPTERAWRPFCSRRCADMDLGKWMTGAYAIPTDDPVEDMPMDDDDPAPPTRRH